MVRFMRNEKLTLTRSKILKCQIQIACGKRACPEKAGIDKPPNKYFNITHLFACMNHMQIFEPYKAE